MRKDITAENRATENQDKERLQQDRREQRRRRRKRNQLLAYITVIVFIVVLAAGIVTGVHTLSSYSRSQEQVQNDREDKVDQILASEPEITAPDPVETIPELTDAQRLDQIVDEVISVMPLEDKVAGLFIVTPESITGVSAAVKAGDGTRDALNQYKVGGLIYAERNIKSVEQLQEMLDNTKLYASYPMFLAVEEEGGKVSPVAAAGLGTVTDSAQTVGQTADAGNAYQAGSTIGGYLSELGFNLNFAPVADLNNVQNSVIAERAYGSDAAAVSEYVSSMITGLSEQGITSCLKHFPGLGGTAQNPDTGRAFSERTAEEFRTEEFTVFQAGIDAGADMVMVGHVCAPALIESDEYMPSSLSDKVVTGILREEMGFNGVVITDSMSQKAITDYYDSEQAAVYALRAGCDMILMPEDFEKAYNGVLQAVQDGTISEERINDSLRRIYRIKYADRIE